MKASEEGQESFNSQHVWDRSVRVFHWINVICVIGLISVGLAILYNKSFGVSPDGKILLKTIHAYFGYLFVINLTWRLIWMFLGNQYSSWRAILPVGKRYVESLKVFMKGMKAGTPPSYLGHNPVAKLMITLLFILLMMQAVTGLVLAGTDLYLPPFGHEIAEWVTGSGEDHSKLADLKPGSKEGVDPEGYKEMREFRSPFITLHKYAFFVLLGAMFLHILGVIVSEIRERSGLVSAMFTGNKMLSKRAVDSDDNE
ncbi:MAG: cytochrome b/b6 domain-containing protein [Mariprofundaceae bacterium]